MTNKKETDPTESQIVRALVLESHGWNSESNRSQCKLRVQEINSLVFFFFFFFVTFYFSFRLSYPFFILRDKGLLQTIKKHFPEQIQHLLKLYLNNRTFAVKRKDVYSAVKLQTKYG